MPRSQVAALNIVGANSSVVSYVLSRFLETGQLPVSANSASREDLSAQPIGAEKMLVVMPDSTRAEQIYFDLEFYLTEANGPLGLPRVVLLDRWDVLPFDLLSPSTAVSCARLEALFALSSPGNVVAVTSIEALMQKVAGPSLLKENCLELCCGRRYQRDLLISEFVRLGYLQHSLVEQIGEVSLRGAVIDLFSPGQKEPVRLEFFGSRLESMRFFEPESQRSTAHLKSLTVLPAREFFVPRESKASFAGFCPDVLNRAEKSMLNVASERKISKREITPIIDALSSGRMWPGLENLQPFFCEHLVSLIDYLGGDRLIVTGDRQELEEQAILFEVLGLEREKKCIDDGLLSSRFSESFYSAKDVLTLLTSEANLVFNRFFSSADIPGNSSLDIDITDQGQLRAELQLEKFREEPLRPLVKLIESARKAKHRTLLVASHQGKIARLQSLLDSYKVTSLPEVDSFSSWLSLKPSFSGYDLAITSGSLSGGIRSPLDGLQVIGESDIFPGKSLVRRMTKGGRARRAAHRARQIGLNDYVVHAEHGIARYRGLQELKVEGLVSDYLHLEFADNVKLYLPVYHLAKVSKYIGAEGKEPALTKLGSKSWDKTKGAVRERVVELAGQLVSLYAKREVVQGFSFGEPEAADLEFAAAFPFQETPDQEKAINEVLADMARERSMDRLVCGDVGYGKTEVAMRAAFKAVQAGKQVAVLVPTTILAEQHFRSFSERFSGYPIVVKVVSRFVGTKGNRETLQLLADGQADIVVGTHRILQRDVHFRNLGLVIIDEEHRFGVAQKERLKRLRLDVDVLTLTATPIPRTLHMSLIGIRDLSVIETPPCDRQVIRTFISRYDPAIVREAIMRELGRAGQAFYLHNTVKNIVFVTKEISELVPEARVEFAHGQMKETELELIMHRFVQGEIDVLVCTTIIESGLDIPNANTIIISEADKLGLAELYQLRGRVGRSERRAYAYLLVRDPQFLSSEARKRLEVLQDLDDLGVGFRLALQDMEIRGAGNLLGRDQSGQVNLVGFDLYSQILKEAVQELSAKGGLVLDDFRNNIEPELNLGFAAHIPSSYIPDMGERLLLFQRLVELSGLSEGEEILEEVSDRYGQIPREVESLVQLMSLRGALKGYGILSAALKDNWLRLVFHPQVTFSPEKVFSVINASAGSIKLSGQGSLSLRVWEEEITTPLDFLGKIEHLLNMLRWSGAVICKSTKLI